MRAGLFLVEEQEIVAVAGCIEDDAGDGSRDACGYGVMTASGWIPVRSFPLLPSIFGLSLLF
jgi:hypothetical protein